MIHPRFDILRIEVEPHKPRLFRRNRDGTCLIHLRKRVKPQASRILIAVLETHSLAQRNLFFRKSFQAVSAVISLCGLKNHTVFRSFIRQVGNRKRQRLEFIHGGFQMNAFHRIEDFIRHKRNGEIRCDGNRCGRKSSFCIAFIFCFQKRGLRFRRQLFKSGTINAGHLEMIFLIESGGIIIQYKRSKISDLVKGLFQRGPCQEFSRFFTLTADIERDHLPGFRRRIPAKLRKRNSHLGMPAVYVFRCFRFPFIIVANLRRAM